MRENKIYKISETIGKIDEKYVNEATAYTGEEKVVRHNGWIKWGAIAACFLIIATVFSIGIPSIRNNPDTGETEIVLSQSPLAIKVYASVESTEKEYTEMSLTDAITITNEYNPLLSSASGIGIHFEFIYNGGIMELTTDNGVFRTWDIESGYGPVTDVGKTYTIDGNGHIFWAPSDKANNSDMSTIKVIITDKGNVVGLASIQIRSDDNKSTFFAELEKAVEIPLVDGEYQKIDQGYIDNFFNN